MEGRSVPEVVIAAMSLAWFVSWWIGAIWSSTPVKRAGARREIPYRALTIAGAYLLYGRVPARLNPRLLDPHDHLVLGWACVALTAFGFVFTWWARRHLGRLWSATVTRKADHHVVDTGPYALVRHPIYTGIIAAVLATAIVRGYAAGFVSVGLVTAGFYFKARLEENFLRGELGAEAYDAYAHRVPMLAPLAPA